MRAHRRRFRQLEDAELAFEVDWDPDGYWVVRNHTDVSGTEEGEFTVEATGASSWTRSWDFESNGSVLTPSSASEGAHSATFTVFGEYPDGSETTRTGTASFDLVQGQSTGVIIAESDDNGNGDGDDDDNGNGGNGNGNGNGGNGESGLNVQAVVLLMIVLAAVYYLSQRQ